MSKLLARFLGVVQRKEFAPESSSDDFFAIPVTSRILHWLAVILVVAGMIALWLDVVVVLFTGHPWVVGRTFAGQVSLRYAVLGPVMTTLFLILGAWVLVLKSELGMFISTVYHSMVTKPEEPAPLPEPVSAPEPETPVKKKAAPKKKKA